MSTSTAPLRAWQVDLTLDLAAPRSARHLLDLLLPQWEVRDLEVIDRAALVLSELVTHALAQSDDRGRVTVGADLHPDVLRLWVLDRSPSVPSQRGARVGADHARGLVVVGQIAARWGVEGFADGVRSYAEVPLLPLACG